MPDRSTPSFSEFVRRHRAAANRDVHDEAEKTAACTFDWVGATAAGFAESSVGVFHHHRDDARTVVPPRRGAKPKRFGVSAADPNLVGGTPAEVGVSAPDVGASEASDDDVSLK
jgi:hypothetical protein